LIYITLAGVVIPVPQTDITVRFFPLQKTSVICVSIKAYTYMTCRILTATDMFKVCLFFIQASQEWNMWIYLHTVMSGSCSIFDPRSQCARINHIYIYG